VLVSLCPILISPQSRLTNPLLDFHPRRSSSNSSSCCCVQQCHHLTLSSIQDFSSLFRFSFLFRLSTLFLCIVSSIFSKRAFSSFASRFSLIACTLLCPNVSIHSFICRSIIYAPVARLPSPPSSHFPWPLLQPKLSFPPGALNRACYQLSA
jgi:hypothetical protein